MLLKEQKSKFSFLASDDEEEERKEEERRGAENAEGQSGKHREQGDDRANFVRQGGVDGGERRRTDRDGRRSRGKKQGGGDSRNSPAEVEASSASVSGSVSDSLQEQPALSQEELSHMASDTHKTVGAHTPPTYNGEGQVSSQNTTSCINTANHIVVNYIIGQWLVRFRLYKSLLLSDVLLSWC